jgi:hypothetical protein
MIGNPANQVGTVADPTWGVLAGINPAPTFLEIKMVIGDG